MTIDEIKKYVNDKFDNFTIIGIRDYKDKYCVSVKDNNIKTFGHAPILVFDKEGDKMEMFDFPSKEALEFYKNGKIIFEEKVIDNIIEDGDDMNEQKIRTLLKEYGADENEIENFMEDLASMKEDIEQINEYQDDEKTGGKDYKEFAKTNNDDSDDKMFEEMAEDEEKHDDYLLNAETLKVLKATKEGRDLIIKAPEMAKEELKKAIADYLQKNK